VVPPGFFVAGRRRLGLSVVPAAAEPAPGGTEPPPVAAAAGAAFVEALAGAAEPFAEAAEPVAGAAEPVAGAAEPVAEAAGSVAGAAEPVAGAAEPAAEPVSGAAVPATPDAGCAATARGSLGAIWTAPDATALVDGVLASDRGAALGALALPPSPSLSIQPPAIARPMSISSTTMMRPHGRRATLGMDSEGSSTGTVRDRGCTCFAEPFGTLAIAGALPYALGGGGALLSDDGGALLSGRGICGAPVAGEGPLGT